ncbi:peroxiredoxin [Corallococcus sp. AB011P]|uniref:peroxiredoxin n=1 Tax=unclassified Corallococcus TaxID=2685029 RepID=UPI000EA0518D|nr:MULTISPECIES: peroxiredoxin [unclassified Corallococcus]RKG58746.1 peroxiredoxin [Corallococcus sp. AB011P]RKH88410.1 peroxiredoxin [Corallococcus sp. AB045]
MIAVGELAPDFAATDCHGQPVRLSELRGRRVVLFFFPRAFTVGCTIENRAFRDNHERIRSLGAELVGVSVDTLTTQCDFAEQEGIHFALLGDDERRISRAWGVLWPILNIDRRVTFIIGADGVVEHVIHHEVRVYRHLDDVLKYLQAHPTPGSDTASA